VPSQLLFDFSGNYSDVKCFQSNNQEDKAYYKLIDFSKENTCGNELKIYRNPRFSNTNKNSNIMDYIFLFIKI